jgi:hypothetical protein
MIMNWKGRGRILRWIILKLDVGIFLENVRKKHEIFVRFYHPLFIN